MKFTTIIALVFIATFAIAESAKIIDIDTGKSYSISSLTNGSTFKIDGKVYRLEIEQTETDVFKQKLAGMKIPIRLHATRVSDVVSLINQLTGVQIVLASEVNQDTKISLSIKNESILETIDLICFQIGAKAEYTENSVRIIPSKQEEN